MRNALPPQPAASIRTLSSCTRQRGWLGGAEFARQQMLLRVGRSALLPQASAPERRRTPRPLHRAMPSVS